MGKNYLPFTLCAFTALSHISYSQENRSIDEKGLSGKKRPVKNKISVYISGGNTIASGKMKDSLFIGNGWNVEGGVYIPLFNSVNNFSFGIEAGVNYSRQKADGGASAYNNAFRSKESTNPFFEKGDPRASTFQIFAGPKAQWGMGKIYVSPSVLLGYLSLSRNSYTLSGTIANPNQPAQTKQLQLISASDYSASGFIIKPKLELGYSISQNLSVFTNGAIAFVPSLQNDITYWRPQGKANSDGNYTYDQFVNGATKTASFGSHWQTAAVSLGIRYTWIKSTFDNGHGGRKQRSSKKPGGAVSSSYAAGRVAQKDTTQPTMPSRLSMTPTTTRQSGHTFGEKVASGINAAGAMPIKGVIVKGGKASGENTTVATTNDKGEFVLNGLETGNYKFTLMAPDESQGANLRSNADSAKKPVVRNRG